jgi:hypothetical protein
VFFPFRTSGCPLCSGCQRDQKPAKLGNVRCSSPRILPVYHPLLVQNLSVWAAPAFLLGLDLQALCTNEEVAIVRAFLDAMDEDNPARMSFVRARGVGDHVEDDARAQLNTFRQGFDRPA